MHQFFIHAQNRKNHHQVAARQKLIIEFKFYSTFNKEQTQQVSVIDHQAAQSHRLELIIEPLFFSLAWAYFLPAWNFLILPLSLFDLTP